jgi:alkyl hydroperoxide reductase subunit AhpC
VKVVALSVDPVDKHLGWINDINETQNCNVDFPIIADEDRKVSELYDFIHPNASATATVRSLVIIGLINCETDHYLSCIYRKKFCRSIKGN